ISRPSSLTTSPCPWRSRSSMPWRACSTTSAPAASGTATASSGSRAASPRPSSPSSTPETTPAPPPSSRAGASAPANPSPAEALEIIGEARNADEIVLSGVVADRCSPAHLRLICKALISDHFRSVYVEWVDGKTLPFAASGEEGDLRGWWRIDLVDWRLGQYRR